MNRKFRRDNIEYSGSSFFLIFMDMQKQWLRNSHRDKQKKMVFVLTSSLCWASHMSSLCYFFVLPRDVPTFRTRQCGKLPRLDLPICKVLIATGASEHYRTTDGQVSGSFNASRMNSHNLLPLVCCERLRGRPSRFFLILPWMSCSRSSGKWRIVGGKDGHGSFGLFLIGSLLLPFSKKHASVICSLGQQKFPLQKREGAFQNDSYLEVPLFLQLPASSSNSTPQTSSFISRPPVFKRPEFTGLAISC